MKQFWKSVGNRMISLVTAVSVLAAVLTLLTACRSDATIRAIRQNGVLRVGYVSCAASEDEPFLLADGTGLTGQPARNAAKAALDVDAEFVRLSSGEEAYDKLLDGSVDCLWNVVPPRKELVSSVRTIETGLYYRQTVIALEKRHITRLADVSGRIMAVVSGSDAQEELHNAAVMESRLKEVKVCSSMGDVLTMLTEGDAHCAAVDEPQALYAIGQGGEEIHFVETPIAENQLVIATRAEDGELCTRLAENYVRMVQNGDIAALCEEYTGSDGLCRSMIQAVDTSENL